MVGDQVHVGAQTGERLVFHRVVAHHEHVGPGQPARRQVLGAVGRLGLDRGGVLVRRDAREQARVHARPCQPPFHGAAREHGHGGQHQRVALLRQRFHGASGGRVRLHAFADLPEVHVVELAEQGVPVGGRAIDLLEERLPIGFVVGAPVVVRGHGADAGLQACRERLRIDLVRGHERGDALEVGGKELFQLHRQQRAVQVEEDRTVRARGVRPGGRDRFGHCGILWYSEAFSCQHGSISHMPNLSEKPMKSLRPPAWHASVRRQAPQRPAACCAVSVWAGGRSAGQASGGRADRDAAGRKPRCLAKGRSASRAFFPLEGGRGAGHAPRFLAGRWGANHVPRFLAERWGGNRAPLPPARERCNRVEGALA